MQAMAIRDSKTTKNLQLVKLFIQAKQYDTAETHLKEYLDKYSECPEALKLMAQIHESRGDTENAVKCYQKSVELAKLKRESLSNSYDFTNSPTSKLNNSFTRNSSNLAVNMSLNSTLDTSQTPQLNGNHSPAKIDSAEIERIIDNKIQPLNDSVQSLNGSVQSLQKLVKDLQLSTDQSVKQTSAHLSKQLVDAVNIFRQSIAPLASGITTLDFKNATVVQTLNTMKTEIEMLTNIVQEGFDNNDEDEEYDDYNDDDHADSTPSVSSGPKPNLSDLFSKKSSGSVWKCPTCETPNDDVDPKCVCCEEKNPNATQSVAPAAPKPTFSFGVQPTPTVAPPPAGGFSFTVPSFPGKSLFGKPAEASPSPSGGQTLFGKPAEASSSLFGKPVNAFPSPSAGQSLFGKPVEASPSGGQSLFGKPVEASPSGGQTLFGKPVEASPSPLPAFSFANACKPKEDIKTSPLTSFSFSNAGKPKEDIEFCGKIDPTPEQLKKIQELKLPMNFYAFENSKKTCSGCRGCRDSDVVYGDVAPQNKNETSAPNNDFSFSNLVSNLGIQSSTVDNINTSGQNGTGEEDEHVVNIDYTSAKSKLLPTNFVVNTGEENDEVLFSERSKLFRLDKGEYKERGLGPMKILKNKQTGNIRLLMRREQVHKVVCNHGIKGVNVQVHKTLGRAVNWVARDYSESADGIDEVFLLKFKNDEQAKLFVDTINQG